MSLSATFDNLWVNLRNIFRGMNTEPLPWKGDRPRSERYRASFALVHNELGEEACIGCDMCAKICPSEIITVVPGGRKESPVTGKKRGYCDDFTLDLNACIICELCVQVCPTDAIVMLRVQEAPAFQREDLVLTMDKLYANEALKQNTWGTGTRLVQMQGEAPKKPKAEKAAAAPAAPPAAPTEAASTEAAPTEAASTEAAPTEAAPTEAAPTEAAPTEAAPDKEGQE
jgi:formate hydrogenlyase subunit 6/NADH:ubiquinone oxidoreductase subunit I